MVMQRLAQLMQEFSANPELLEQFLEDPDVFVQKYPSKLSATNLEFLKNINVLPMTSNIFSIDVGGGGGLDEADSDDIVYLGGVKITLVPKTAPFVIEPTGTEPIELVRMLPHSYMNCPSPEFEIHLEYVALDDSSDTPQVLYIQTNTIQSGIDLGDAQVVLKTGSTILIPHPVELTLTNSSYYNCVTKLLHLDLG